MKANKIFKIIISCLILIFSISLVSCKENNLEVNYIVDIKKTESVGLKDIYTIYYKDGSTETFEISNGANGIDGKPGLDGKPGENGQDGKPGINGVDGKPGIDGKIPHIGENGNWFIGDYDTGISATGPQGKPGENGLDGKPGINGQDGKPGENAPHYGETFKVTYHLNGGTFNEEINSEVNVNWGDTLDLPIPYKYGYAFEGWYTGNSVNDKQFTSYDAVFRNIDLYAKYVPGKYKVTLDLNGGTTSSPTEYFYVYGSRYELPTNVFKAGYNFVNWTLDGKDFPILGTYNYENITLVANYKKISNVLTVAEAIAKAKEIGDGAVSNERFIISGKVKKVINPQYGEMIIYDETGELSLYSTYNADGSLRYSEMPDKPYQGDKITVSTTLRTFNGEPEGHSALIQSFEHVEVVEDKNYTKMSITEARNVENKIGVEVTGTVAKITYADGGIENGFFLVDANDSIYVHDDQIAPRVKVGNKVTIRGTKEMYILSGDLNNAIKHGYTGSCQISNVTLVQNDNNINKVDLSFAEEITIKNLINKQLGENYRTKIYKTTAYINKVPGNGFVNYFINDLDNTTGSYCYSLWSGKDYGWLDEFDGKICTVYLSVINMKATDTGCIARFVPIEVKDENFQFDLTKTNQFVYDYYIKDNFDSSYDSNKELELLTSFSRVDLGFENVEISYESSDTSVLTIDRIGDKLVMNTKHDYDSTVTLKIIIKHNNKILTKELVINLLKTPVYKSLTVKEAIESTPQEYETPETCEKIIVKGVAGPSLVNQVGFYLIDETGVIAVKTTTEVVKKIKLGDLVTLEGIRAEFSTKKNENSTMFQTCLLDAELLLNEYGNHEYSTASFDNTKTLADLVEISQDITSTTKVYTLKCEVEVIDTQFYTNIRLTSTNASGEKVELLLYCANAKQYEFLTKFAGQGEITVEVALCNYNNSVTYRGAVLSATGNDGIKVVNELNYQNY